VWASDCNDPVERQSIQRWTAQLLPPEFVGSHVGEVCSHTTGRLSTASFRLLTALFGHAGIEQDLTRCSAEELRLLTAWSALYREFRPLLHSGRTVRADLADESNLLHGVIAADGSAALYCWVRLGTAVEGQPGRVPLPGLDPEATYLVRVREDVGLPAMQQSAAPAWLGEELRVRGAVLTEAGLPMPNLQPDQALLLEVRRYISDHMV
jgi:alpha-galactosidase